MKQNFLFILFTMLALQTLFAQVPSYVPTNGLVAYWPFDGNANDESGNGNNGTVNGATLTTDRNGNANSAYSFDGQSYIRVTHNQNFNFGIGNYTLSVWANKNGNNFLNALLTKATPHPATGWTFGFVNNDIRFLAGVQNSNFLSNGSVTYGPINNGEWNNYIAVFNPTSNSIKIYINGQVVVSDVVSTGLINCDNIFDLMFGVGNPNGAPSGPEFFNGFIDDIGIWNRALTQQEITNLYNSVSSSECLTMVINSGPLSTNPVTYTSTVNIFPNPANNQITIDCGNLANVVGWNIKITNALGQEVFSAPMNTQLYVVPLNSWSGQGMYFVKILNAQNEVVNIKKIILQ
ncbi:MAG: hypothetical protein RL699_1588 [Bacteroidota bacterium]|jgi:hypothetical protein